ncbi:hypothetical protein WMY93_031138 [Mugilogobius chulae]|uniref:Uncharacterized protein n=1 Tax=Mugilogobius chulae TaxID=88201 RepID=A0AAW0MEV8_9GOBI
MSERDIERFITQVLQTNEPQEEQEEQQGFPLLRATAKCALALLLLLALALGLSQPQSPSESLSLGLNWSCLRAVRLLELPIAHKYNLQGFRCWLSSTQATENSSVCADPEVLKTEQMFRVRRAQLELLCGFQDQFSCSSEVQPGPANFTLHWSKGSGTLLFPSAQLPLLNTSGFTLQRCVVSNLRPSLQHLQQGVEVMAGSSS